MDDIDRSSFTVLGSFAVCLTAAVVGYIFAWQAKRTAYRRGGALIVAAVAGFAGLVAFMWGMGAALPYRPEDGDSFRDLLFFVFVFGRIPVCAFYLCAIFIGRAIHLERIPQKATPETI